MIHYGVDRPNFTESEFSEDPHAYASYDIIDRLQRQREILGHQIYPSKAKGALARFDKPSEKSRHYCVKRKSTALDWFSGAGPFETYTKICKSGLWDGIGIYFDTFNNDGKSDVMFHTDLMRSNPLMWYRVNGIYHYWQEDGFWDKLIGLLHMRSGGMTNSNQ